MKVKIAMENFRLLIFCGLIIKLTFASDITDLVFPKDYNGVISAYGDFNSDELTDVFILKDDFKTIEILLGHDSAPLLHRNEHFMCHYPHLEITSLVPGDFDGDALMDVMFTAKKRGSTEPNVDIYINYGGLTYMNCTANDSQPVISGMYGEPLAIDYMNDMIIDLFGVRLENGEQKSQKRSLWIFDKSRNPPKVEDLNDHLEDKKLGELTIPHSHAILDWNDDGLADLCLSTKKGFEIWLADKNKKFKFDSEILFPIGEFQNYRYGQAVYADIELNGNLALILPVCLDDKCTKSKIWVHSQNHFKDLDINFWQEEDNKTEWGFIPPNEKGKFYEKAMTLRMGDFNNDGYVDLLATLERKGKSSERMVQTFLLENVNVQFPRENDKIKRTFAVRWNALNPFGQNTVMASFYDFYQDGILDVIMVQEDKNNYKPLAFRNTLDYDANFVKVIVLTGLENSLKPPKENSPFGSKSKSYGSNLPGPKIKYHTTTQEGLAKYGASTQLPQSAYFSLHLPYQIFGLGRTPNFVDNVEILFAGKSKVSRNVLEIIIK